MIIMRFAHAGSYGNKLGITPSLSQMLEEWMEASSTPTGVCDGECYVEIDEKRHYFWGEYFDPKNPCKIYICKVRITMSKKSVRIFFYL